VSQVLLDVEPGLKLFGLIPEGSGLHEWHTWLLAPAFVMLAWGLASVGQRLLQGTTPRLMFVEQRLGWLRSSSWSEAVGAAVGVVSHLLLDALYHTDVAAGIGLPSAIGLVPQSTLDISLLLLGVAGIATLWHKARHHTGYMNSVLLK